MASHAKRLEYGLCAAIVSIVIIVVMSIVLSIIYGILTNYFWNAVIVVSVTSFVLAICYIIGCIITDPEALFGAKDSISKSIRRIF